MRLRQVFTSLAAFSYWYQAGPPLPSAYSSKQMRPRYLSWPPLATLAYFWPILPVSTRSRNRDWSWCPHVPPDACSQSTRQSLRYPAPRAFYRALTSPSKCALALRRARRFSSACHSFYWRQARELLSLEGSSRLFLWPKGSCSTFSPRYCFRCYVAFSLTHALA